MKYSLLIPVYNRPDEVDELLDSLTRQTCKDFEVVVVDDGSTVPCADVVTRYTDRLDLHYYAKTNSGPGQTRNYAADRAQGEYLVILDSDVVLPPDYLSAIDGELRTAPCDAFGGPDRAHPSFTPLQKAINYAMTSFFTTGGIRGGKKKMDKFYPRSFNMGMRAAVYRELGGFSDMRFGEDIDLSTRLFRSGRTSRLLPDAWVWHKRRTDLRKFFKQVHNSGIARINLTKRHPGTLKAVHLLPAVFTVGCALCLIVILAGLVLTGIGLAHFYGPAEHGCVTRAATTIATGLWTAGIGLTPLLLFTLVIGIDATRCEHSLRIGALAVAASYVQLTGYGSGFLRAWWRRCVLGRGEFDAFRKNFYK